MAYRKKVCIKEFDNDDTIFSLALSSKGRQCAMGGIQRIIKIFDIESGKPVVEFKNSNATITALAYILYDKLLVSGPQDGDEIKVWDISSGKIIEKIKQGSAVVALASSPDGKTVAYSNTLDSIVHYFEINLGKESESRDSCCLIG